METRVKAPPVKKAEEAEQDHRIELHRTLGPEGIEILGPVSEAFAEILTPDALRFVAKLARRFAATRDALLDPGGGRQGAIF